MTLTSNELARFASAIATRLGLRVDPDRACELIERRATSQREPIATYLDRLDAGDPSEIRELTSELTVGETYFLRHIEQFRAFADVVVPERLARGRLHVLSLGCSSGEEPYSLAMLLREQFPAARFTIHAIDLNPRSIARARAGRYSRWSLRATSPAFEQRWFQPIDRDVVVVPEIRAAVTFEQANILDDGVLSIPGRWDVVFCRNMLMYLTEEHADAAIRRIARALAHGGYLFLGHAETLRDRTDEFALCHTHGAFYYQRQTATTTTAVARTPVDDTPHAAPALPTGWYDDIHAASQRVHAMIDVALDARPDRMLRTRSVTEPPRPVPDLDDIRELFVQERFGEALAQLDQLRTASGDRDIAMLRALILTHAGRFAEARETCDGLLALDANSSEANYLLALCCESTGDTDRASQLAQRAADLDPSFAMPRVHLGLLARRDGDRRNASRELIRAIALLEHEPPARLALYGGGFSRQALLGMCRAELAAIGAAR
jgi:chemotaxis protein methyltransferase CheR